MTSAGGSEVESSRRLGAEMRRRYRLRLSLGLVDAPHCCVEEEHTHTRHEGRGSAAPERRRPPHRRAVEGELELFRIEPQDRPCPLVRRRRFRQAEKSCAEPPLVLHQGIAGPRSHQALVRDVEDRAGGHRAAMVCGIRKSSAREAPRGPSPPPPSPPPPPPPPWRTRSATSITSAEE